MDTLAVCYLAKSNVDLNDSLSSQLKVLKHEIEAQGWVFDSYFEDEDESGYSGSRGEGLLAAQERARDRAEATGLDVRLCAVASDRFARGDGAVARHLTDRVSEARQGGYHLWTVLEREQVDSYAFAGMFGDRNHHDSVAKSSHVKRGLDRRWSEGKPLGKPTRGNKVVRKFRKDGSVVTWHEEDPEARPIVVEGARLFVDEDWSSSQVAKLWNDAGFTKWRGGRWTGGDVGDLFRRPAMGGFATHGDKVEPNRVPAILPDDLYQRLLVKLAARAAAPGVGRGRSPRGVHLFTRRGVVIHGLCGAPMKISGGRYACTRTGRFESEGCDVCTSIHRRDIDRPFLKALVERHLSIESSREAMLDAADEATRALAAQVKQAEELIRETKSQIRRAYDDWKTGELTGSRYEKLVDGLEDELETAEQRAEDLRSRRDDAERAPQMQSAASKAICEIVESIEEATRGGDLTLETVGIVRSAMRSLFVSARLIEDPKGLLIVPELRSGNPTVTSFEGAQDRADGDVYVGYPSTRNHDDEYVSFETSLRSNRRRRTSATRWRR